jgi:heme exporter protein A
MMRLVATDLACVRADREVFSDVAFTISAGEALVVLGRNGAGKSSLLRLVAGLVPVAGGRLVLDGGNPELTTAEQAHYVGHLDPVKGAFTVKENLQFWSDFLSGESTAAAIDAALRAVALEPLMDVPAAYLSAGQKRRLSLARLLTARRPIWLLDEPTAALDTAAQERLSGLMRNHLTGGGIILAATHGPLGLDGAKELRLGEAT